MMRGTQSLYIFECMNKKALLRIIFNLKWFMQFVSGHKDPMDSSFDMFDRSIILCVWWC